MNNAYISAIAQSINAEQAVLPNTSRPVMKEESLPFRVKLVLSEEDLHKAVYIRHAAYARHVPEFAKSLAAPESVDAEEGVAVLLAESKFDGSPLGTMRIQTNAFKPLSLEQSVELPDWLQGRPLAEATRLGVTEERVGRVVKTVLFKAFFLYCQQIGVEWMVVTGRSPIDRQYDRLLFKDVYPGMGYIPFQHVGNMLHRVLCFDVNAAEKNWTEAKHPLFDFIFRTNHVDIDLSGGVRPMKRLFQTRQSAGVLGTETLTA